MEISKPYKSRFLFFVKLDYQNTTALIHQATGNAYMSGTVIINIDDAHEMIATVINVTL